MATQRIDLTVTSPVLQQMFSEEVKTASVSKVVSITSGASKKVITSSAPRLEPVSKQSFEEAYAAFMTLIAAWETFLLDALNKLNQIETGIGKSLLDIAQVEVEKAKENAEAAAKAREAAAHQSFWSKFASYFVAAFALVVTALTGGTTAFLLAAVVTAVMLSPAAQELDKALQSAGLTPAEAGLVQLAIVIAVTVVLSGGAGLLDTMGEDAGVAAAEEAGEGAASKATVLDRASSGLTKANMLAYGSQAFTLFNPTQNFTEALLEATGTGKDKAKLIAMIMGIITSVLAMAVGMKAGTSAANGAKDIGAIKSVKDFLGPKALNTLINALRLLRAGANVTSNAFKIQQYKSTNDLAALQEAVGAINSHLMIEKTSSQMEYDLSNQGSEQYNKEMQTIEQMIANESKILAGYDAMARA